MECITHCHCISHLITSHYGHHILHCIIPHRVKRHLWHYSKPHHIPRHIIPQSSHTFHIAPAPLAAHYSTLQYHSSNRTISATLCITPLTSRIAPHYTLQTYHITPHSMYSTTHQFQITPYIGHTAPPHLAPHFTQHCTASFHHI